MTMNWAGGDLKCLWKLKIKMNNSFSDIVTRDIRLPDMLLKIHFLHRHLDFSSEFGRYQWRTRTEIERLQDISVIETRYQDRYNPNMKGGYTGTVGFRNRQNIDKKKYVGL